MERSLVALTATSGRLPSTSTTTACPTTMDMTTELSSTATLRACRHNPTRDGSRPTMHPRTPHREHQLLLWRSERRIAWSLELGLEATMPKRDVESRASNGEVLDDKKGIKPWRGGIQTIMTV